MKKKSGALWLLYVAFVAVVIIICFVLMKQVSFDDKYSKKQFLSDIDAGIVTKVVVNQNREVPTGYLLVSLGAKDENGEATTIDVKLQVSDVNEAERLMEEHGYKDYIVAKVPEESFVKTLLPSLISLGAIFILFLIFVARQNSQAGGGPRMTDFGRSRAKMHTSEQINVNFNSVAGLREEKEELAEIVDFLKDPKKYSQLGARIPKGMILVGPPGTGKTLLAKAIAGEAHVPFFSISGSDFLEMFVGVGAARVRDLFEDARHNAPCIVFIDEIDAVARMRGTGMGGGHDEREQTLNQLLVEMDGFGTNEGVIVLAATNRVDILDPAIMRPGRFDRKVYVGRPDVKGREEILGVHTKNKPIGDDVDLNKIAKTTSGFSGADLENLMNEAAISAAKDSRAFINMEDVRKSFVRVGIGTEKKSRIVTEKERRITAYHEAGHAILFHVLPNMDPVYTVSIIPTGSSAAGYTMPIPEHDDMFRTKGEMLEMITVDLGGRVAEELIFDDITTGASQDIKNATEIAKDMVMRFGMSDNLGLVCYNNEDNEVFIGKDLAHAKGTSEQTANLIEKEIRSIIDNCHKRATTLIQENIDVLHKCAELLLEKEKISKDEFEALFEA